ncbi:MAG: trypsin-like serine protease [Chitinivibrionales bacterium]|nr:trypsin-like serine protease [Chitinivibrionales bacterium]
MPISGQNSIEFIDRIIIFQATVLRYFSNRETKMSGILRVLPTALLSLYFISCTDKTIHPTQVIADGTDWASIANTVTKSLYYIGYLTDSNAYEGEQAILVGTGFAVSRNRIITNAHVVSALWENTEFEDPVALKAGMTAKTRGAIRLEQYKISPAYTGSFTSADIGVLLVNDTLSDTLTIADSAGMEQIGPGQKVATMGFPGETMIWSLSTPNPTFTNGSISAVLPLDKPDSATPFSFFFQHNLDLTGGTSGSPIFNTDGHVIAVNNSGYPGTAIGYGISASYVGHLTSTTSFDSLSKHTQVQGLTFAPGSPYSSPRISDISLNNLALDQLKGLCGYNYSIVTENDSLRIYRFTDYTSYMAYAFYEKAAWFEDYQRDRCALFLITDVPQQSTINAFTHQSYEDILVGVSKTNIQLHFGLCRTKRVEDNLLLYEYRSDTLLSYYNRGISLIFIEDDEYASAIALYDPSADETPYATDSIGAYITRYRSAAPALAPLGDTTIIDRHLNDSIMSTRPFKEGKLEGTLREYDENGILLFEGIFSKGQKNGSFKYYDSLQILVAEYSYVRDTLHGDAKFYTRKDTLDSLIRYAGGNRNGKSMYYFSDGSVSKSITYQAGKLHDTTLTYHSNGNLKTFELYKDGERHGDYKEYFENGKIHIDAAYQNDELHGVKKEYYREDSLTSNILNYEQPYKNGKWDGVYKKYRRDGTLQEETPYKQNARHGVRKIYQNDGRTIVLEIPYINNKVHGTKITYYPDGVTHQIDEIYNYGVKLKTITYNPDGSLASEVVHQG